jgi:hypothetical protein
MLKDMQRDMAGETTSLQKASLHKISVLLGSQPPIKKMNPHVGGEKQEFFSEVDTSIAMKENVETLSP